MRRFVPVRARGPKSGECLGGTDVVTCEGFSIQKKRHVSDIICYLKRNLGCFVLCTFCAASTYFVDISSGWARGVRVEWV